MARSVREILVWNPADELLSPACEGLLNEARSVHLRLQDALDRGQPIKTALASLACNMGADSEDEELAELRMFVSDVIAIAKAAKAPHRTERCKAEHRMRVQASYTSEDSHPSFVSPNARLSGVESTKPVPIKTHCQPPALPRLTSVERSSRSTAITEAKVQANVEEMHPSDSDHVPLHRHLQLSLRRHLRQKARGRALRGKPEVAPGQDSAERITGVNETVKDREEPRLEKETNCKLEHCVQCPCNEIVTVVHQERPTRLQTYTGAQNAEGRNAASALSEKVPGASTAGGERTGMRMCLPAGSRHAGRDRQVPTRRGGGMPALQQDLASFHQTQDQVAVATQPSQSTWREQYDVQQDGFQRQVVAGKQRNPDEFVAVEHRTLLHPAMHPAMPIPERGGLFQSAAPQPQQAAAQDGPWHETVLGQVIAAKADLIQPTVCGTHPGLHQTRQASPAHREQRCQLEDLPVSALDQTAERTTSAPSPLSTWTRPAQPHLLQTSLEAKCGSQDSQSGLRELLDDVRSSCFRSQSMPAQDHAQATSERSGSHSIGQIAVGQAWQAEAEDVVSTAYSDNSRPDVLISRGAFARELRGTHAPHALCQDLAQLGNARIGSSADPMPADSLCAASAAPRSCSHAIVHQAELLAACAGAQSAGHSADAHNNSLEMSSEHLLRASTADGERTGMRMCLPAGSRHAGRDRHVPTRRGGGMPALQQDLASFHQTQDQVAVATQPSQSTWREQYDVQQDGFQRQVVGGKQRNPDEFVAVEHRTLLHPAMHPAMPIPERGGIFQSAAPQPQQAAAQDGPWHETVLGQVIAAKADLIQPTVCGTHPGLHQTRQASPAHREQRCQLEDLPVSALDQTAERTTSAPSPLSTWTRPAQPHLLQTSLEAKCGSQDSQSGLRELLDDVRSSCFRSQSMPAQDHAQATSERSGSHSIGQIAVGQAWQAEAEDIVSTAYSDNSRPDVLISRGAFARELRGTDAPHAPCQDLAQLGNARIGSSADSMPTDSLCAASVAPRPCSHAIVHQAELATGTGAGDWNAGSLDAQSQDIVRHRHGDEPPVPSAHPFQQQLSSEGLVIGADRTPSRGDDEDATQSRASRLVAPTLPCLPGKQRQDHAAAAKGKTQTWGEGLSKQVSDTAHLPLDSLAAESVGSVGIPLRPLSDTALQASVSGAFPCGGRSTAPRDDAEDTILSPAGNLCVTSEAPALRTCNHAIVQQAELATSTGAGDWTAGSLDAQSQDIVRHRRGDEPPVPSAHPFQQQLSSEGLVIGADRTPSRGDEEDATQSRASRLGPLLQDVALGPLAPTLPCLPGKQRQDHAAAAKGKSQTQAEGLSKQGPDTASSDAELVSDTARLPLDSLAAESVGSVPLQDGGIPLRPLSDTALQASFSGAFPCGGRSTASRDDAEDTILSLAENLCVTSEAPALRTCNHAMVHQAELATGTGAGDWNAGSLDAQSQDIVQHRHGDEPPVPLARPFQQQLSSEGLVIGADRTPSRGDEEDATQSRASRLGPLFQDVALGPLAPTLPCLPGKQRQDHAAAAKGKSQTQGEGLSKQGPDIASSDVELVSDTARLPLDSLAAESVGSVPLQDGGIPLRPLSDSALQAPVSGAFPCGGRSTASRDDAEDTILSPAETLCVTSEAPALRACNHAIVQQGRACH